MKHKRPGLYRNEAAKRQNLLTTSVVPRLGVRLVLTVTVATSRTTTHLDYDAGETWLVIGNLSGNTGCARAGIAKGRYSRC